MSRSAGSIRPLRGWPRGGDPASSRFRAGLAVRVGLLFDEAKADLRHTEEFECIVVGLGESIDPADLVAVDHDDRDLRDVAPERAVYELPAAPIGKATWFRDAEATVVDHLHVQRTITVLRNVGLKVWSRPGESADEFAVRCGAAAAERADAEAAKVRAQLERRIGTIRTAIDRDQRRIGELEARAGDAKQHELVSAAGDLLGSFLGGRRSARSVLGKVKGVSSRRKQTSAAGQRVETALAGVEARTMELADLEAELLDELTEIQARWSDVAAEVEEVEVGLEKTDIDVRQLALVWVPA